MGRPRKYASDAERQAAHRARQAEATVRVNRGDLEALLQAVDAAAATGDEDARKVRTGDASGLIRNLARLFEERAGRT